MRALLFLLLLAGTTGAVAVPFLPVRVQNYSVLVGPALPSSRSTLLSVSSGTTVYSETMTNVTILDVCNRRPACDARLSFDRGCIGITSSYNCLKWVGQLDTARSTGDVLVLSTFQSQCMRVRCVGTCSVHINWYLANVYSITPATTWAAGRAIWHSGPYRRDTPLQVFQYNTYWKKQNNPAGFSIECPGTTHITMKPLTLPADDRNKDYSWLAIGLLLGLGGLATATLASHHLKVAPQQRLSGSTAM